MKYLNDVSYKDCIGKVCKSLNSGDFKILKYNDSRNVEIQFVTTGFETSAQLERIKNDRYSIVNIIIMKYIERNEADENKLELKELMNLSEDNNKSEIFSQNYENVNNVVNSLG